MANRDKSQGFGFVYVDIEKLLAEREDWQRNPFGKLNSGEVPTVNFSKEATNAKSPMESMPATPATPAAPATVAKPQPVTPTEPDVSDIRKNLDRLQSLHHKLHAMLEELNRLTEKKR